MANPAIRIRAKFRGYLEQKPDSFDRSPFVEGPHGVHFYITRKEAEDHI
jgi:hypothetical protein